MSRRLVCIIVLLFHAHTATASPRAFRRVASIVAELIQKAKTLTTQVEFERGVKKILDQTKNIPRYTLDPDSHKEATRFANETLDEIQRLIDQHPTIAHTRSDELATIVDNLERNYRFVNRDKAIDDKISDIRRQINELNTTGAKQPLEELLDEHDYDLNIQTADNLLKHAKGHALSIAEKKGIKQLDLDNGIKNILDDHINLDEYRIENFSLEDLEIALRVFTPDEEIAFKKALGTNWRQYLFVIENSKTREGEQLLSLVDIQKYKLMQDFVSKYLDNLNAIVPEYQHRFPDELFSALHKHDNSYAEILQYSEVYSQQIGELKTDDFLLKQTESFMEVLEKLKNANDKDSVLSLGDELSEKLISLHKEAMNEIEETLNLSPKKPKSPGIINTSVYDKTPQEFAMIDSLNRPVENVDDIKLMEIQASLDNYLEAAVGIDNIQKAYARNLLEEYGHELDDHLYELHKALSEAYAKFPAHITDNIQPPPRRRTTNNAYREAKNVINNVEDKLDEIRSVVIHGVDRYKELEQYIAANKEVSRKYRKLGWRKSEGGEHTTLTNTGQEIIVRIPVPRSTDINRDTYRSIFRQARGAHVANKLISEGVVSSADDLKKFMTSEKYQKFGNNDEYKIIGETLNPIRKRIGLNNE